MRQLRPRSELAELANSVLSQAREEGLPIDLLARDAARSIVERAIKLGCIDAADTTAISPPYGAESPAHKKSDSNKMSRGGWPKSAQVDRENGAAGLLRVESSLNSFGDFFRYVIEPDVTHTWLSVLRNDPLPELRSEMQQRFEASLDEGQHTAWRTHRALGGAALHYRNVKFVVIRNEEDRRKRDAEDALEEQGRRSKKSSHRHGPCGTVG
jgi:hypothetical protein